MIILFIRTSLSDCRLFIFSLYLGIKFSHWYCLRLLGHFRRFRLSHRCSFRLSNWYSFRLSHWYSFRFLNHLRGFRLGHLGSFLFLCFLKRLRLCKWGDFWLLYHFGWFSLCCRCRFGLFDQRIWFKSYLLAVILLLAFVAIRRRGEVSVLDFMNFLMLSLITSFEVGILLYLW